MTLDKIEKALADYDAKMADGLEEYGYWSSRIGAKEYVDAVRLLLPIAQAARELTIQAKNFEDFDWCYVYHVASESFVCIACGQIHGLGDHLEGCAAKALSDAVNKLKGLEGEG